MVVVFCFFYWVYLIDWNLILNKDNGAVPGLLPAKVGGSHRIRRKRRRSGSDSNNTNEGIEDRETGEFKCITSSSEDSQLESGEQAEFKSPSTAPRD